MKNYYETHKELFEAVQKWEENWKLFLELEVLLGQCWVSGPCRPLLWCAVSLRERGGGGSPSSLVRGWGAVSEHQDNLWCRACCAVQGCTVRALCLPLSSPPFSMLEENNRPQPLCQPGGEPAERREAASKAAEDAFQGRFRPGGRRSCSSG